MLKPKALVSALVVDLATTLLDAETAGAGAIVRGVLGAGIVETVRKRFGKSAAALERQVAARLALSPAEYRTLGDGDVATVVVPAAALLRGVVFDGARYFAEQGGEPEAAARALFDAHGVQAGVPPEPLLQRLVLDLVIAWFATHAEHPLDAPALESVFRTEVLRRFERLESNGDTLEQAAQDLRELLLGRSILPLPQYAWPEPGELAPSALLDPRYAVVPFAGREDVLSELLTWCDDPEGPPLAVALVHGIGGRGKTRLMLELAVALHRGSTGSARWPSAGLLELDATSLVPEQLERLFRSSPRVLVGIDRAERNVEAVEQVLRAAWSCRRGRRVRVVLGARSAGDWWASLRTRGEEVKQILGAPGTREIALAPLAPSARAREAHYRSAQSAFATALGHDRRAWDDAPVPPLDAAHLDDSLLLHMAALATVLGFSPESESELFDSVLDAERHYWRDRRSDPSVDEAIVGVLGRVLAVVSLAQGAPSRAHVRRTVAAVLALEGRADTIADQVTDRLYRLYARADGALAPLHPDRLGEFLVLRELERAPRLLALALEEGSPVGEEALVRPAALTVLTRLAKWRAEEGRELLRQALHGRFEELIAPAMTVARETGDPIGQVAAEVLDGLDGLDDKKERAWRLIRDLPSESVALRELAELVTRLTVDDRPPDTAPAADHLAYAVRRLHLSNRWSDLGRREDALVEGLSVVALFERNIERMALVDESARDYTTVCRASAYSHLSIRLASVGASVETMSEPARRVLSARLPPGELADRIRGLEREELGRCALDVGLHARALAEPIVKRKPAQFAKDFSQILTTLSNRFDELGCLREAYEVLLQCEKIYQWIRYGEDDAALDARAGTYGAATYELESDHATTLMNLSNRLGSLFEARSDLPELERRSLAEQALERIDGALALDRGLVESHPDAYRPKLATTLSNRAIRLVDLGRHAEAVDDATEAIAILLELRTVRPTLFTGGLVAAYTNRVRALRELGGRDVEVERDERERDKLRSDDADRRQVPGDGTEGK